MSGKTLLAHQRPLFEECARRTIAAVRLIALASGREGYECAGCAEMVLEAIWPSDRNSPETESQCPIPLTAGDANQIRNTECTVYSLHREFDTSLPRQPVLPTQRRLPDYLSDDPMPLSGTAGSVFGLSLAA